MKQNNTQPLQITMHHLALTTSCFSNSLHEEEHFSITQKTFLWCSNSEILEKSLKACNCVELGPQSFTKHYFIIYT